MAELPCLESRRRRRLLRAKIKLRIQSSILKKKGTLGGCGQKLASKGRSEPHVQGNGPSITKAALARVNQRGSGVQRSARAANVQLRLRGAARRGAAIVARGLRIAGRALWTRRAVEATRRGAAIVEAAL